MNSLSVLAAASLAGADLALAGLALSQAQPAAGRGVRQPTPCSYPPPKSTGSASSGSFLVVEAATGPTGSGRLRSTAAALSCSSYRTP